MMSTRGPIPCKFGVQCHRPDCWYSHPEGRAIDAGGGGGRHSSNGVGRGAPMPAAASRPGGGRGTVPGSQGGLPQASPRAGGGGGSGGGGATNECRYSFECKRRDCHFNHPFGRAIDADGNGGGSGGGGRPSLNRPPSNGSMGSVTRGMSEVSFGSYPPANATDDDQDLKDTWFPKARECTCCKGYVYGCTSNICESIGQCTCSIEEKDLDGSSSVSSSSISRTGSPQIGMGTNGSPMGMAGGGGARPPHAPTEAAIAAAAGGGARPSARGAGSTECRYGTGCKRADCSYNHSQGRSMDADGVSFGDFGPGGGGNKHGGAGGKPTVDQDLMDTWYPDSRECTCCKGYKHGCKAPACAEAGLCACCAGPAAPIAAVSSPPSALAAGATDASGSPPGAAAGNAGVGPAGEGKYPPPTAAGGAGVAVAGASEAGATS